MTPNTKPEGVTIITRVAKALYALDCPRWPSDEGWPEGDNIEWAEATPDECDGYRKLARAAIETLGDPTDEMILAAIAAGQKECSGRYRPFLGEIIRAEYRAAVSAALNPKDAAP